MRSLEEVLKGWFSDSETLPPELVCPVESNSSNFDARSDNRQDKAVLQPFKIADVEIHQKETLPLVA